MSALPPSITMHSSCPSVARSTLAPALIRYTSKPTYDHPADCRVTESISPFGAGVARFLITSFDIRGADTTDRPVVNQCRLACIPQACYTEWNSGSFFVVYGRGVAMSTERRRAARGLGRPAI